MAERRRSAHAGDDQNNGGTLSAQKNTWPAIQLNYIDQLFTSELSLHHAGRV